MVDGEWGRWLIALLSVIWFVIAGWLGGGLLVLALSGSFVVMFAYGFINDVVVGGSGNVRCSR